MAATAALLGVASGCTCADQAHEAPASRAGTSASASPRSGASASPGGIEGPLKLTLRRTTSAEAVLKNLFSTEKQLEKRLKSQPKRLDLRGQLITTLLLQVSRLGKVSKLARVIDIADAAVRQHPKRGEAYLLRARALVAVHQFDDAQKALDKARELGASEMAINPLQATIYTEIGKLDEALAILESMVTARANHDTQGRLAYTLGFRGRVQAADAAFVKAMESYRGVSPLVVAWLHYQRGYMWERNGDVDKARQLYRATLHHLPQYAHAAAHLVPLVSTEEGERLLRGAAEEADDPEYIARLAVLLDKKQAGSGRELARQAETQYEGLLKRFPAAFADHGGWFYLEVAPKPARAVELARLNVSGRPTAAAYELLLTALIQAGKREETCAAAKEAEGIDAQGESLRAVIARAKKSCPPR